MVNKHLLQHLYQIRGRLNVFVQQMLQRNRLLYHKAGLGQNYQILQDMVADLNEQIELMETQIRKEGCLFVAHRKTDAQGAATAPA